MFILKSFRSTHYSDNFYLLVLNLFLEGDEISDESLSFPVPMKLVFVFFFFVLKILNL